MAKLEDEIEGGVQVGEVVEGSGERAAFCGCDRRPITLAPIIGDARYDHAYHDGWTGPPRGFLNTALFATRCKNCERMRERIEIGPCPYGGYPALQFP